MRPEQNQSLLGSKMARLAEGMRAIPEAREVGLVARSFPGFHKEAESTSLGLEWGPHQGTCIWCWILEATSFGSNVFLVENAMTKQTGFLTRLNPDLSGLFLAGLSFVTSWINPDVYDVAINARTRCRTVMGRSPWESMLLKR